MPRFPGIGARIRERLLALGYVKSGKADVERFILARGYSKTLFNYWLSDKRAPGKDLDRLVRDLKCKKSWLFFGDEAEPDMDTTKQRRAAPDPSRAAPSR